MKEKIKKIVSNKKARLVLIAIFAIGLVLIMTLVVKNSNIRKLFSNVAISSPYKSDEIEYDNKDKNIEATTMQGAIDELYEKCLKFKNECPEGYTCINNKYSASNNSKVNQISETSIEKSTLVDAIKITKDDEDVTSSCTININGGEGVIVDDTITFDGPGIYEISYDVTCEYNKVITPSSYVIINNE